MSVAAIDCGTNTIKLLIGDLPDVAVRETRMVRLGQDVDRTGRLADEALARAFAAIDEYAALIESHGVERLRFCATSATRDAANAEDFSAGVFARLGVRPEVLTGAEEAAIAFDGAVRHLAVSPDLPVLVVDVGGGSTELILGETRPRQAHSMDIGSVRLHERHLHDDPPTAEPGVGVRRRHRRDAGRLPGRRRRGGHRRRRVRHRHHGRSRGARPAVVRPGGARPTGTARRRMHAFIERIVAMPSRSDGSCPISTRAAPT